MATRIIPGVNVSVVQEVVPPQLSPSGVLGIVGLTKASMAGGDQIKIYRASSWNSLKEQCGTDIDYAMPEARQALENGVFELVVAPVNIQDFLSLKIQENATNALKAVVLNESEITSAATIELVFNKAAIIDGADGAHATLTVTATGNVLKETINITNSSLFQAVDGQANQRTFLVSAMAQAINSQSAYIYLPTVNDGDTSLTLDFAAGSNITWTSVFDAGSNSFVTAYQNALELLKDESDVDMITASVVGTINSVRTSIYSSIVAHCNTVAQDSKPAIGIGQIPVGTSTADAKTMQSSLVSERFVLLAGQRNIIGAVAGRIGSLTYYESPTFKTLSGLGVYENVHTLSTQRALLSSNIVPIVNQKGRGIIILRGLTTNGDQINVRRIADRAVRAVKNISELFIGELNTGNGRASLFEKITEYLLQMEKDNAIVPSIDSKDPAFKLDVYSSQADFAQGIVRIDLAVRPVRAIDFIYATILVQA